MKEKKSLNLGLLKLQPINSDELAAFKHIMENTTLPKIKEDVKLMSRNVAVARQKIAYVQHKN